MQPVLNVEDVRQVELALTKEGVSLAELMRRAGAAAAQEVMATALATATSWVYDSDSATSSTPCSAAISAALPARIASGWPASLRPTLTSANPIPREKPVPNALSTASRAANRAA